MLPKRLKIIGKYFKIVTTQEGDYGECDVDTCIIKLRDNQNSQMKKDTLLHEAIHAIDDAMGLNLTEKQVRGLGTAIYALFHDNKHFAKWLMEKSYDGKN